MFLYMLIACELGLLYTVFWYIYLRDPNKRAKIKYDTWGQYDGGITAGGGYWLPGSFEQSKDNDSRSHGAPTSAHVLSNDYLREAHLIAAQTACGCNSRTNGEKVKPFMVPIPDEMVFDKSVNRYRPAIKAEVGGWRKWVCLWEEVDDKLSVINVRP